jgi:transcription initiation factor IIF auxiliary subunit
MQLKSRATSAKGNTGWWNWSVWVEADPKLLRKIAKVTYTLHPTFPDPVQVVTSAKKKFQLNSGGWGEFMVYAVVEMREGTKRKLSHWLALGEEAAVKSRGPTKHAARARTSSTNRVVGSQEGPPRVFLLHALRDSLVAHSIAEAIEKTGVQVETQRDLNPKLPFKVAFEQAMSSSQAAIVLVGDELPSDVLWSANFARNADVPVLPVVVGAAKIPADLRQLQAISLGDGKPGPKFMGQLGAQLGLGK